MSESIGFSDIAWYSVAACIVLSPLATTLWSRRAAMRTDKERRAEIWLRSRQRARAVRLVSLALWWATWDLRDQPFLTPYSRAILFFAAPVMGIGISYLVACTTSRAILDQNWTGADILKLTWWSTFSVTIAVLLFATGFEFIYEKHLIGTFWIFFAGLTAVVGTARLRVAEGLKLRRVKSGKAYVRAFQLAREMGVRLDRVFVVPAGRGHLTNAYGTAHSVAITDNYGEFLHGSQLDYVIGHELGHVKEHHWRKRLPAAALLYTTPALIALMLPPAPSWLKAVIDLGLVLGPALALYYLSRRFEYAADRDSVELTRDPIMAIKALVNLHRMTGTPTSCSKLVELFLTHPSLTRRAVAIAYAGRMSPDRLSDILDAVHPVADKVPVVVTSGDQHAS